MGSELLLAGRAVETVIWFTVNEDLGKQIIPTTAGRSKNIASAISFTFDFFSIR